MSRRAPYRFDSVDPQRAETRAWRSLEEKSRSEAERQELAESEFPQGVGPVVEESSLLRRRGFLTLGGGSAALAALQGCVRRPVEKILPYSKAPEQIIPGVPLHYATVLERRGDALGLVVQTHEGRPTKVEGNPEHPSSLGAAALWAQAAPLDLYDPDRSQAPQKSGEGKPVKSSFAEFDRYYLKLLETHAEDGGQSLRFLLQPSTSPTSSRLRAKLKERFPKATLHFYAPVHESQVLEGTKIAFGQSLYPVPRLEKAKVVLSLDSDFLQTEPGAIRNTKGYAKGRFLSGPNEPMSRLYVVEPLLSLTGANADHRLRVPARDVEKYLQALTLELGRQKPGAFGSLARQMDPSVKGAFPSPWLQAVASDLIAAGPAALLMVGSRQPARVHALAHALHVAFGAVGQSIAYAALDANNAELDSQGGTGGTESLAALVKALRAGQVQSLVILGGNPAFDAPRDLDFAGALGHKGVVSIHLASHYDETSRLCDWHLPLLHAFESWGDSRAIDGTWSIQQPLIRPLWTGRSVIEMLSMSAGSANWQGYLAVRETFRSVFKDALSFENSWRQALNRGLVPTSEATSNALAELRPDVQALSQSLASARSAAKGKALGAQNLEVVFTPDPKLFDGRHANNPWLLELPDPMTKISWDNAALVSPATAKALGIASGDIVRLRAPGAKEIEIAAWVQPGQADWSIALPLGWGRDFVGQYGSKVGFDVQPLRTRKGFWFSEGAQLEKTGRTHRFAQTQEHDAMEGRPIAIDATLSEYQKQPDFASWRSIEMSAPPLWKEVDYEGRHRWGMAIDLSTCTGCNACVVACQSENNTPVVGKDQVARGRAMYWIRIDRYFVGEDESEPAVAVQPIACQHCEEAPCENVCPVNATAHSPEGLNDMAYNRCIGTRYCANNCPYKVRRFNYFNWHIRDPHEEIPEPRKMQFNPNVTVRSRGVMEKCTYCVQRIQSVKIEKRRQHKAIKDGDIVPACAQTCPADAITFGDLSDPKSKLVQRIRLDRRYRLLAEIGTQPRTTFLARIRNPNPAMQKSRG